MKPSPDPAHATPDARVPSASKPPPPSSSTSRAMTRVLAVTLLALALVPPLVAAVALSWVERDRARASATALAWVVDRHDRIDGPALQALLESDSASNGHWREALDAQGLALAQAGDESAERGLLGAVTVRTNPGSTVAAVKVHAPATHVLAVTAVVALLSCTASALIWTLLVRRSVGVLRRAEGQLRTISTVDPLTGLLNRTGLGQRLVRALARRNASALRVGLVLIDLDRFRLLNESLGQQAGDELLRAVAERLRGLLRPGDAAARLGGDQFAVMTRSLMGPQAASVMAQNLLRAFAPPFVVGGRQAQLSASVGIVLASSASQPDMLVAQADAAMRAAKAGGGGRHRLFEPSMLVDNQRQLELDMALRRAAQTQEFELAFQPIVSADGRAIHAVEALLRWNHPKRGPVSPAEFIPLLEQTGLIVAVGDWVLREACHQVQAWNSQGLCPVMLSVNVSPIQFAEPDFVGKVMSALQATGLSPRQLQLEVTEGLLLDPTPEALHKMDALVDAGVRLAVDDFGVGYSSLAYLKRFRLHALKIDRLFVREVPQGSRDAAIVRAIVELAHALDLRVTAEGVETAEQHEVLRVLGCDLMQGYLFARPMSAAAMREKLAVAAEPPAAREQSPADWSTTLAGHLDLLTPVN